MGSRRKGEREKGGKGEGEPGFAPLLPGVPSGLLARMMALSVAYQRERSNVEADDLTALVIRALGMIVGKMVRDDRDISDVSDSSDVSTKRHFVLTSLITAASQKLVEVLELDINLDQVTSRRIGRVLKKMRMQYARKSNSGSRGWLVSLDDLYRRAGSYGLDIEEITGIPNVTHLLNVTTVTNVTNVTVAKPTSTFEGIL